jgi:hypothetical protein
MRRHGLNASTRYLFPSLCYGQRGIAIMSTHCRDALPIWMAYQFDLPETGEGLVVVLKRPLSQYAQAVLPLHALEEKGNYEITKLDTADRFTMTGKELAGKGLSVRLPAQPDSSLLCYRRR